MDFDLSPEHALIRTTARDFAEGEVAPVAEELDRTKAFPYEIVARLGELNMMGVPFPQQPDNSVHPDTSIFVKLFLEHRRGDIHAVQYVADVMQHASRDFGHTRAT